MAKLRRLVMMRHGETEGKSSVRFHGRRDLPLSDVGRAQVREAARRLHPESFDLIVTSPMRRAWESARIVAGAAPIRVEAGLHEIDFGRWEGLTREEIERADPVLARDWLERAAGFEYPGGELRADFTKRVLDAFARIEEAGAGSVLVVAHKGVIRTIAEDRLGEPLPEGVPELAGAVGLTRDAGGRFRLGRRSSNPLPLRDALI